MDEQLYKLIVRAKDWYANMTVTRIEKDQDVVFAYFGDTFVGAFDLGSVDALYMNPWYGRKEDDR